MGHARVRASRPTALCSVRVNHPPARHRANGGPLIRWSRVRVPPAPRMNTTSRWFMYHGWRWRVLLRFQIVDVEPRIPARCARTHFHRIEKLMVFGHVTAEKLQSASLS